MTGKIFGILGLLVALCVFMTLATSSPWHDISTSSFLKTGNLQNLLNRTALYGILGVGVVFVIITSGIDLSIGSMVCFSGVLLAIFLHVDYRPLQSAPVVQVDRADGRIDLRGDLPGLSPGDRIRYSGGTRAPTAVLTVDRVDTSDGVVRVYVAESLKQDDVTGQVVRMVPIVDVERLDGAGGTEDGAADGAAGGVAGGRIVIGQAMDLGPRDQIKLVHPQSGLRTETIVRSEAADDRTAVFVRNDPGARVSAEWLAVPLKRHQRMSVPAALLSVLLIGCALGLLHGLLVTRARLQPFVVTLCGLLIYRGLARWLTDDNPAGFAEYTDTLCQLGSGRLIVWTDSAGQTFGIPYPFFILIAVGAVAAVFLNRTIWGRYLLALGRNEEAARFSGINTKNVTLAAWIICTGLAATGGILFALDSLSISPSSFGNFFELYAIAAAVLGGCSLRGGEGSIPGVIIGTAAMQVLNNLIVLLSIPAQLEGVIIGFVILLGVLSDELIRQVAARRRQKQAA